MSRSSSTNIKISTARNPLGLELGERIHYMRRCRVDYDGHGVKKLWFDDPERRSAKVTGVVKKAVGQFHPSKAYGWTNSFDPPEPEPAYLEVDHYEKLYECRQTIESKSFFVHPDDICD